MRALGHEPLVDPLLKVAPLAFDVAVLNTAATLAFTSVNGVEACARASALRDTPVFAVGRATARAAKAAGFTAVRSADGDVAALAALLIAGRPPEPVVHPSAVRSAGDLVGRLTAAGVSAIRLPVYDVEEAARLPTAAADAQAVLLHSPRAAEALVRLADADLPPPPCLCLSHAVAEPLRAVAFDRVEVAARPEEAALLALLPPLGARRVSD